VPLVKRWNFQPGLSGAAFPYETLESIGGPVLSTRNLAPGTEYIIGTQDAWSALWSAVGESAPDVDFQQYMVLGVTRLITGAGVQAVFIESIEKKDGGLIVHVKSQIPPPGAGGTGEVDGFAADFVLVKRTDMPFIFVEEPIWISK